LWGFNTEAESFDACRISYIRYDMHEIRILCLKLIWAESFDACRISYIRYDMHEIRILCLKLIWLIKWWDISKCLSYDRCLMNIRYANAYLMLVLLVSDWSFLVCQQLNIKKRNIKLQCCQRKCLNAFKCDRIIKPLKFDNSS
jgi:hypothetical protein